MHPAREYRRQRHPHLLYPRLLLLILSLSFFRIPGDAASNVDEEGKDTPGCCNCRETCYRVALFVVSDDFLASAIDVHTQFLIQKVIQELRLDNHCHASCCLLSGIETGENCSSMDVCFCDCGIQE